MKPYPFVGLNHFTFPVAIIALPRVPRPAVLARFVAAFQQEIPCFPQGAQMPGRLTSLGWEKVADLQRFAPNETMRVDPQAISAANEMVCSATASSCIGRSPCADAPDALTPLRTGQVY